MKHQYFVRLINLNDETIKVLKKYQSWQDDYILSMGDKWQGEDRVFMSKCGGHINSSTCATILNGKGVVVKTISELL